MPIRYRLQSHHITGLAKRFELAKKNRHDVLRDLTSHGIHVLHYRELTTMCYLEPLAELQYDTLLQCAQQFGPNPITREVAAAETHLQSLLTREANAEDLKMAVNNLSKESFWEIYARMYNPLMRVGLAQDIFARHFDAVQGRRVLDVGAGTGILTNAEMRNGREVTAVEPQLSMRLRMLDDATTIETDSTLTIEPSFFVPGFTLHKTFDHIVMRYVFYLFADHRRSLETAYAMLNVGGTIAISNPLPKGAEGQAFQDYLARRRREIADLPLGWRVGIYDAVQTRLASRSHLVDRSTLCAMLEEIGFRVTIVETFEMDTAIFIVGKKVG